MSRLKLVPYKDLAKVIERAGFSWVRRSGSHNTFRNDQGLIVVIPDHGTQVIVRPLLRKILRESGISLDDYSRYLEEI